MPTYEYECKSCGHTFEAFQAMSDEPLKSCPQCGREIRRLIFGGTGVIFKGSGFYVTDKGKKGGEQTSAKPAKTQGSSKEAASTAAASSGTESAPKSGEAAKTAAAGDGASAGKDKAKATQPA
jgi:putative FmdB family regulatory protein